MNDRIDSELGFSMTALRMRGYRQELLASNIANADTPNYKARDFDFKSSLADAMAGRQKGELALATTSAGHVGGASASGLANAVGADVKYRSEYQGAVDGNTVNMDIERAAFAENAMQMEALLTFVKTQFKDFQAALQS